MNRTDALFEQAATDSDRVWPLDLLIAALSALILYLAVKHLRLDDPRWLYNAWTYLIAVPAVGLLLAGISHLVASRYVHKSVQIGFLFSVALHLLMLIVAINVIIFRSYFPEAISGVKQERSPIRRTIPEYLFETPPESAATPDWSRPVEAESAARAVPLEKRPLAPVEPLAGELRAPPAPPTPTPTPTAASLNRRETAAGSLPQPADAPTARDRARPGGSPLTEPWSSSSPTAPAVALDPLVEPAIGERREPSTPRSQPAGSSAALAPPPGGPSAELSPPPSAAGFAAGGLPEIGTAWEPRGPAKTSPSRPPAAGAAPAAPTVAVARDSDTADRVRDLLLDASKSTQRATSGADLAVGQAAGADMDHPLDQLGEPASGSQRLRSDTGPVPQLAAGPPRRGSSRSASSRFPSPLAPPAELTGPPAAKVADSGQADNGEADSIPGAASAALRDRLGDRLGSLSPSKRTTGGPDSVPLPAAAASALEPWSDQPLAGPAGPADRYPGALSIASAPNIAALELQPATRQRLDLGPPIVPFGSEVTAAESFRRRAKRTAPGALVTPPGDVGPETEEAIERGLEYLARIQNDDGSWSLQGHGSDVVLQSDTAATGLSLLAFQGAGYTHRQHQYAARLSRAIQFLLQHQKTNGDLYRSENAISNQNVALYSHGIAALALCESYGMTQDPELQAPAQSALDYIVATQHSRRGGWRYTPQISADTSVTGWMMMALKSGELAGLSVPPRTYLGIERWLGYAQGSEDRADRYRYNPFAPDTAAQRHGRIPTPTMTAVGMLMRMYLGWDREREAMQSAADYLLEYPPQMGTSRSPQRDAYYWYYATMVMFHMGGGHWRSWNSYLKPLLLESQVAEGELAGSWDPVRPLPDRWSPHAGRLYVTTMNLLNLEVYYRHLPIYEVTADR